MAKVNRLGQWNAWVKKNPQPDGLWWPLEFMNKQGTRTEFCDVARTHPTVFGVWREADGTYTVAIKAEAKRERLAGYKLTGGTSAREVKRRNIPDLLMLRTYLISLAEDPNCP
jgi:hypothetical protein